VNSHLAALIAGAIGIAFAPILVRFSELPPTPTALWRMVLAIPFFLVARAVAARRSPEVPRAATPAYAGWLLAGAFFAGDLAAWHRSIQFTSVANATLLANFAPVLVTLVAWLFFRERITGRFLLGLVLALAGAGMLVRVSAEAGPDPLRGDLWGLLTAVFYAGYQLTVKRLRARADTLELMTAVTALTAVVLALVTALEGSTWWPSTARGWLPLLALGAVPQFLGQGLIAYAMAGLPASFASVSLLLQPATATFLAWVILGERLGGRQALGGAAILLGVLLARRASASAPAEAASEPG
jgi:drug/metabolite transporter (DMT)-like permease